MSAAVARRGSPRVGRSGSQASSPTDSKKAILKSEEENSKKGSPLQSNAVPPSDTETTEDKEQKDSTTTETTQPLAPPPRPAQQSNSDTDYFSGVHNTAHLSLEPNPFEQSFGEPSTETPGKSLLPPVAALTSPALPGTSSASGFNWSNSLRAGPLSPAMLAGPAGSNDYFDSIARGFPTPNESSLRTGLTPGGGGSMFPAPSPNSQVLLQQLQNSGATPSTLDFHRTAINAAKSGFQPPTSNATQEQEQQPAPAATNMDTKMPQAGAADPFAHHDATDAANGLFMLAKGGQPNGQFPVSNNQTVPSQTIQANPTTQAPQTQPQQQPSQEMPTNTTKRGSRKPNTSVDNAGSTPEANEMSVSPKPNPRGRGKRAAANKAAPATNGRRKADDTPAKGPNKKAKSNASSTNVDPNLEHAESEEPENESNEQTEANKKLTDEEKRKNFLERNRIAALKCRQRKKQWQANLQTKVEIYSSENDALSATITQLREEIVNLKTLLMAHKDCPVAQTQGINSMAVMNGLPAEYNPHTNPYGMAIQQNGMQQNGMQQNGMQQNGMQQGGIQAQGLPRR